MIVLFQIQITVIFVLQYLEKVQLSSFGGRYGWGRGRGKGFYGAGIK